MQLSKVPVMVFVMTWCLGKVIKEFLECGDYLKLATIDVVREEVNLSTGYKTLSLDPDILDTLNYHTIAGQPINYLVHLSH